LDGPSSGLDVHHLIHRHFADEKVDIAVIETGMGGLTDATNVIDAEHLQLAVITSLGGDPLIVLLSQVCKDPSQPSRSTTVPLLSPILPSPCVCYL